MSFNRNTRLNEILTYPIFSQMKGQFVSSSSGDWFEEKGHLTLTELEGENPTWSADDILYGIENLIRVANHFPKYVYHPNGDTGLIYLPAEKRTKDTFVILLAGGAYGCVCTMVEALPVAARLNGMGIDCFCLNYRTAKASDLVKGLMPKPLDDLAEALKYIDKNKDIFSKNTSDYILCGFSAGGHLAAMFGTPHLGARSYGLANPRAILLDYPLISLNNLSGLMASVINAGLLGAVHTKKKKNDYCVEAHIDDYYPKTYLIGAMDDDTVPKKDSEDMEKSLKNAKVKHKIERVSSGGHGFGLGDATDARGWIGRAVDFAFGE